MSYEEIKSHAEDTGISIEIINDAWNSVKNNQYIYLLNISNSEQVIRYHINAKNGELIDRMVDKLSEWQKENVLR